MAESRLSDIEIQRELGTLPGWSRRGETLVKTFTFPTFPRGIEFVTRVASAAEVMQHHPDLDIRYTKILAALSTHEAGGITVRDVRFAREMERLSS